MKKFVLMAVALVVVIVASVAGAAVTDHGKRLTPPFCIGNDNAGANAGVVRSVAFGQTCRSYEHKATGLAVPDPDKGVGGRGPRGARGAQGPKGDAGPQGAAGATGAAGSQGPAGPRGQNGAQGPQGPAGPQGPPGSSGGGSGLGNGVVYACVSNGGTLQLNVNGKPCDNNGHTPIKLVVVN